MVPCGRRRCQFSARGRSCREDLPRRECDDRFSCSAAASGYAILPEWPSTALRSRHTTSPIKCRRQRELGKYLESLLELNERLEVVFPVHPRTRQRIDRLGINIEKLHFLEPLTYIEFLSLQRRAVVVITDSDGVQEETTYLGVPCLTLRSNAERPVTVNMGTNVLVGRDRRLLDSELTRILEGRAKKGSIPPLWDGRASDRIVRALREYFAP